MGQGDVMEVLEKTGEWMTIPEVMKITKTSKSATSLVLRKLAKRNEIRRYEFPVTGNKHRGTLKYKAND